MEKTLFWDRILPLKLKHIPASNVILPPDAQRVVILVMEVGVQIQQRLAQRKIEQLCLFCCGANCLYTLTPAVAGRSPEMRSMASNMETSLRFSLIRFL